MTTGTMRRLPLSEPVIQGNAWTYVKECLDTNWVSSAGKFVERFEQGIAARLGVRDAVSCVNGTSALHLAYLVVGVRPDDEVIVPTLTFIAPVNAVTYCGAVPVFMDADPCTLGMDPVKLEAFLTERCEARPGGTYNRTSGRRIAAVVPVHVFGHPVDLAAIAAVCTRLHLPLIEDATESLGSCYRDRAAGTVGDIGCLSFNGNKIITTGGGGMLVTSHSALAARARHLSTQAKRDPLTYEHDEVGYNYRMTNLQAALGVAQLELLDRYVAKKRQIHAWYRESLAAARDLSLFVEQPWARSNYWLNYVRLPRERRATVMRACLEQLIEVRPVWQLNHRQPMYRGCESFLIEHAETLWAEGLNLPSWLGLEEPDVQRCAQVIMEAGGR
jgi:perosamine synthetase